MRAVCRRRETLTFLQRQMRGTGDSRTESLMDSLLRSPRSLTLFVSLRPRIWRRRKLTVSMPPQNALIPFSRHPRSPFPTCALAAMRYEKQKTKTKTKTLENEKQPLKPQNRFLRI